MSRGGFKKNKIKSHLQETGFLNEISGGTKNPEPIEIVPGFEKSDKFVLKSGKFRFRENHFFRADEKQNVAGDGYFIFGKFHFFSQKVYSGGQISLKLQFSLNPGLPRVGAPQRPCFHPIRSGPVCQINIILNGQMRTRRSARQKLSQRKQRLISGLRVQRKELPVVTNSSNLFPAA